MRSPFPGMDPYLERRWGDVHSTLITYTRDAIQPRLPGDLTARTEERVMIGDPEDGSPVLRRLRYPDVGVAEGAFPSFFDPSAEPAAGGAAVAEEPLVLLTEPATDRFVRIEDVDGERLVTAIKILSPTNKLPGEGRRDHFRKRREYLSAGVNVVEIDLLRVGNWREMLPLDPVPPRYDGTYHVTVRPADEPGRIDVYPIWLGRRLPTFRIPLRSPDETVTLDLQAVLDLAYANGRYDRTDYNKPCAPPLAGDAEAWADEMLRAAGRRGWPISM